MHVWISRLDAMAAAERRGDGPNSPLQTLPEDGIARRSGQAAKAFVDRWAGDAMTTEIVEYNKTDAALSDLAARYKSVIFDVTTPEGMRIAKLGRTEIRKYRTSLEDLRVAIKAPALLRCQLIDSEARRITAELLALEKPIDEQIKNEEQRKESERMAAVRAEQERLAAVEKARKDEEERKLAEERAALAAERAKLDAEKLEREAQERAARAKLEDEERAVRKRIEDEERAARLAREEADRKARAEIDARERASREAQAAEDARLKKERDALEAERRAAEDRQRAERQKQEDEAKAAREAEDAKQREIRRKEAELDDAKEMLALFVERFGHLPEYKMVVAAIKAAAVKQAAP